MTDLAAIRYDLISPLLQRYKRRFTLLDLGAGINPYMAQRISREFDAVVVAIEQDEISPAELAKFGPRALWLRKTMSAEDLKRLGCCEHFDIALALNFLHHVGPDWRSAIHSIRLMTSWLVVQTPSAYDKDTCGLENTPEIHGWCEDNMLEIAESVQFEKHAPRPIYEVKTANFGRLTSSSWTSPDSCIDAMIASHYDHKSIRLLHKPNDDNWRTFIHGLNLWNFAQLGGAWPRKDAVLKLIREFPLPAERHGDITPHNFLFDGAELHLIDGHEGWEFDDAAGLKKTEEMVGDLI